MRSTATSTLTDSADPNCRPPSIGKVVHVAAARNWRLISTHIRTGPSLGSYAYLRATEGEAETVEVRRPRHQYQFTLRYDATDWRVQLDATTVRGLRDIGNVTLENYWLLNLTSQWSLTPTLELELRARNLLDESYEEVAGYRSPDLHLQAGLNLRFD